MRTKLDSNALCLRALKLLADKGLRNAAGPAVFQRGQGYAASDAVQEVQWKLAQDGTGLEASAIVAGTHDYATALWVFADEAVDDDDALGGDCDCPHGQDGNFCKHQVALALVLRGLLGGELPQHSAEAQKKGAAAAKRAHTQAGNRDKLKAFVQSQSAADLAERVWQWAQAERNVMADLKAWAAQTQVAQNPKGLKTALTDMLKASGFLDWRACTDYARRADKVLPLLEQALLADPVQTRALCEHVLLRLYKAASQADDSNGSIGGVMGAVQDILYRSLQAAPPPAGWLSDWFKLMQADPWGNWNERALLKLAGPALHEAYSRKVAQDWQAYKPDKSTPVRFVSSSEFDLDRWKLRKRYLEDLQHQDDPLAVIDAMRSSAEDAREHSQLVEYCEAQKKYREALQFAQAAYKRFPDDWRTECDLLRCYERDGWDAEALAIRRKQLEKSPIPEHFRAVLLAAKAAGKNVGAYRDALYRWAEEQELAPSPAQSLMLSRATRQSGARHVSVRLQWLLAEGRLDDALALVQPPHVCLPALLKKLALALPAAQHAGAVQLLLRVFASEMPGATTPYHEVLTTVAAIGKRMADLELRGWLLRLRVEYKAKRNFIKGLDAL